MKKSNVLRSDLFHMDEGDVLHMLFLDEEDTPITLTLNSVDPATGEDNIEEPPGIPVALPASDVTVISFTANWNYMENTLGFYLDVATDSAFTSFVAGYNNLDVGLINEYSIVGLDDAIPYYYRLRGYNDYGTGINSDVITVTTANELVQDFDGNIYTYVTIGTQQWMVENFRGEHYIDGTVIPNLTLNADWIVEDGTPGHDGAYCYYNNDEATYKPDYGALYNWYAVNNAHGFGITGWRVPSNADWNTLATYLGGATIAGGKLKEVGLIHWDNPNLGASDEYGFTLLPSGSRGDSDYEGLGGSAYIGSSDAESALWGYMVDANNLGIQLGVGSYLLKYYGISVRLMRDV